MKSYTEENGSISENNSQLVLTYPPLLHKMLDYRVTEIVMGTLIFGAIVLLKLHR
ncbi:hypothetical protein [Edaphobacter bradus]|uniref:hypothetical protein n=1 Tax=Edaphobacter bradus TaxID=2259016 RepID=UPI0021DF44CC|nr:hypothetical protein [Edaphobacter bradus]